VIFVDVVDIITTSTMLIPPTVVADQALITVCIVLLKHTHARSCTCKNTIVFPLLMHYYY